MYACECDRPAPGLGLWTALIPIGSSIIGGFISGDGATERSVYYPDAKRGILHCEGPFDVAQVADAYGNLDGSDPLRGTVLAKLASDKYWGADRYGMPSTPLQIAGALVAWAHGKKDCKMKVPDDVDAAALVDRILDAEAERQRTLRARVEAATTQAVIQGRELVTATVIPGVPTPLLAIGALGLAAAFFFRR